MISSELAGCGYLQAAKSVASGGRTPLMIETSRPIAVVARDRNLNEGTFRELGREVPSQDENTCRKPLTPFEGSRSRERRAKVLAPKAAQNKGGRPKRVECRACHITYGEDKITQSGLCSELRRQRPRNIRQLGGGFCDCTGDPQGRRHWYRLQRAPFCA